MIPKYHVSRMSPCKILFPSFDRIVMIVSPMNEMLGCAYLSPKM